MVFWAGVLLLYGVACSGGKDLLQKGHDSRIGDGRTMNAVHNSYILCNGCFKPLVGLGGLASPRVDCFIKQDRS